MFPPNNNNASAPPAFAGPPVVFGLVIALVAIHGLRQLLPYDWDRALWVSYSFIPAHYAGGSMPVEGQAGFARGAISFVTYSLLHASWSHVLMNSFWMLIFGTPVARRTGTYGFLLICLLSAAGGALAFLAGNWNEPIPMIGASGVTAAMLGVLTGFVYLQHHSGSHRHSDTVDERIFFFAIFWLAGDLITSTNQHSGVAWEAHIGGFITGLLLGLWFGRRPRAS